MGSITKPSVQSLLIIMRFNGQQLSTGTGFIVNSNRGPILVTNRHNVTGRNQETNKLLSSMGGIPNEIAIVHNCFSRLGEWVEAVEALYDAQNRPLWKEHPALKEKADIVGLPLTKLSGVQLYPYDPLQPGPDILVGPADSVSVIGFPFGLTAGGALGIWATGFLASEMAVDFNGLPIFLIDCRGRPGQSGSPVIAYRSGGMVAMADGGSAGFAGPVSRFLGIYSGRINAESDLGIVWKAAAVAELILSI